jgi:hypothetical protein
VDYISRARVAVTSTVYGLARRYTVAWRAFRESRGVEYFQPQGLHFNLPADAVGVLLAPSGDPSASVLVSASGPLPTVGGGEGTAVAGEGGLHYLGAWRVYLDSGGRVHLGSHSASDWVARSSLTDARLDSLRSDIAALKSATQAALVSLDVAVPTSATFIASTAAVPHALATVASSVAKTD